MHTTRRTVAIGLVYVLLCSYCILDCEKPGVVCSPGSPRYKQVLEFHMVALPSGISSHQVSSPCSGSKVVT